MPNIRHRSPRSPSISLPAALQRIESLYKKENKHPVAPDAAAQGLGYKDAKSGPAKTALASLSYYGLIKRNADGKIAVAPEYEKYLFAPDEALKAEFLTLWLSQPKVFSELLEKYKNDLPSDAALKYELIDVGFNPSAAEETTSIFKESLEFVKMHGSLDDVPLSPQAIEQEQTTQATKATAVEKEAAVSSNRHMLTEASEMKPIPIFLPRQREAILYVPRPFYMKDKEAIKRYLEALSTDDEDIDPLS